MPIKRIKKQAVKLIQGGGVPGSVTNGKAPGQRGRTEGYEDKELHIFK